MFISEKGIRSLRDFKYLKVEGDYEKIGLTYFEKLKLKDAIASLHTVEQDDGVLNGHKSLHVATIMHHVSISFRPKSASIGHG